MILNNAQRTLHKAIDRFWSAGAQGSVSQIIGSNRNYCKTKKA